MKALVIIAHGSRRQASNEGVSNLTQLIANEMQDEYPIVLAGFLELADPLIPAAIDACIEQGAKEIAIIPYFLSAGRHVHEDIPNEVQKSREQHPQISMQILQHIGGAPQMKDLIRASVTKQQLSE